MSGPSPADIDAALARPGPMWTAVPRNEAPFSVEDVLVATGGALATPTATTSVRGVTIDASAAEAGNVFVPIVGERRDGHVDVPEAVRRGVGLVVASGAVHVEPGVAVVRVKDTVRALGDLARYHHRRWCAGGRRTTVVVTGSVGKTTTRTTLGVALRGLGVRLHESRGNLNNLLGLPLTVFGLSPDHDAAVLELASSIPGEIARGAEIAPPDVAVLTRIGEAHLQTLGSLEAIAREKTALFDALRPGSIAVGNADDPTVLRALRAASARVRVAAYGVGEGVAARLVARTSMGLAGSVLDVEFAPTFAPPDGASRRVKTSLLGAPGAHAVLAALTVAAALRPFAALPDAITALASVRPVPGRFSPRWLRDDVLLIDDSYNASPQSVLAALDTAQELAVAMSRRFVVVLGEMRGLGGAADELHDAVARRVVAARPGAVMAVAGRARRVAAQAALAGVPTFVADDVRSAVALASRVICPGDLVLVKGAARVGLGAFAAFLAAHGHAAGAEISSPRTVGETLP